MNGQKGSAAQARPDRFRGLSTGATIGAVAVAIAIALAAILARGLPSAAPSSSSVASTQGVFASQGPVESGRTSTAPATAEPGTAEPTPGFSISGDVPGPDATIPPGNAIVPGLTVAQLADTAVSMGLACRSTAGGEPGWPGGFQLGCEGVDGSGRVDLAVTAVYWRDDGVVWFAATVIPDGDEVADPSIANDLLSALADLAGGAAVRDWVAERIGDDACRQQSCNASFTGMSLSLDVGEGGAHQFRVSGDKPAT